MDLLFGSLCALFSGARGSGNPPTPLFLIGVFFDRFSNNVWPVFPTNQTCSYGHGSKNATGLAGVGLCWVFGLCLDCLGYQGDGGEVLKWEVQIWTSTVQSPLQFTRSAQISSNQTQRCHETTRIAVRVSVLSPELVPVVSVFSTGAGSSCCVLLVNWATGVGSGWCIFLLYVSIGLLYGFSLWCHVAITCECLGRSLDMGLSLPILKCVTLFGPFGVIRKLLNVFVSSPLIGGSFVHGGSLVLLWWKNNSRWAPSQDVLTVIMYVTNVSVIVFMTLITYHMFNVDL